VGETDDVVENSDEVGVDEDGGARDYDYLLGVSFPTSYVISYFFLTYRSFRSGPLRKNESTSYTSRC
jgi:hypothetical protein